MLPPFACIGRRSVEEASDLLGAARRRGGRYCGGTELLLVVKLGLTDFGDLVDVKGSRSSRGLAAHGELRIGASSDAPPDRALAARPERCPRSPRWSARSANLRVRNVGTIGGNLCFADPHSDPATYLMAAGGSVSARARRRGGAADPDRARSCAGSVETAPASRASCSTADPPPDAPEPGSALVHQKMSRPTSGPRLTVAVQVTGGATAPSPRHASSSARSRRHAGARRSEAERALLGIAAAASSGGSAREPPATTAAGRSCPVADSTARSSTSGTSFACSSPGAAFAAAMERLSLDA